MTNKQRRKIIAWWWGRVVPEEVKSSRNLSDLSEAQLEELERLKEVFQTAQKNGVDYLGWGHQFTVNEFISNM